MNLITNTLLILTIIIVNLSHAELTDQTLWETTKLSSQIGVCRLRSNKLTVTVFPYYLNVEEEAEITTTGTIKNGDPNSLEITGEFQLSPGTTIRSSPRF